MYYTTIIASALFVISPILSLPFIFYDVYKRHVGGLILFALFMGLLAYLTPPFADLYRHTRDYFNMYEYSSFDSFSKSLKDDFLVQSFSYFLYHNGIKYTVARLLFTSIEYGLLAYVLYKSSREERDKRFFIVFLFMVFGYNFFWAVLGVRHCLAMCLYGMGCYLLYITKEKVKCIFFFAIAPCIHFFYFALVLFAIFFYYFPFRVSNKQFALLAAFSVLFGLVASSFLVGIFFNSHTSYLDGQWGTGYFASTSFKGAIYFLLKRLWALPLFVFFLNDNNIELKFRNLVLCNVLSFLLTMHFGTISDRYIDVVLMFLMFYYFISSYSYTWRKLYLILFSSFVYFSANMYTYSNLYIHLNISHYTELWKPLPLVLSHDYTKEWTYEHIDFDGNTKKRYLYE